MAEGARLRLQGRSMGLKLLLVCALALAMSVPATFVFLLLGDRTERAQSVSEEIGGLVGGRQLFAGPVLAVPYQAPATDPKAAPVSGAFVVFPVRGEATVATRTEVRRRSLFKVPVYRADLAFRADFDLAGVEALAPRGAVLDWSRAEFLVGATNPRGARSDVAMSAGGRTLAVAPSAALGALGAMGTPDRKSGALGEGIRFFGAPAAGLMAPNAKVEVAARMAFTGAERLAVLPYGKRSALTVTGDWPDPSFDGGFLPVDREVGPQGFTARWDIPFIARGVAAAGGAESLAQLGEAAVGVSFVEPANPYQSVSRALKYAPMFLGLVFLAFFVFETIQRRRVHAAQYVLIGLAQLVFYLLLLSLAERVGFDTAFGLAAGATVSLISAYAGWTFEDRRQGLVALAAFSVLYGLIYVLMRLEDLALLIGALTSFGAIATVMYVTRRLDWYGDAAAPPPAPASAPASAKDAA